MASDSTIQARIDAIDAALSSGAKTVTLDGVTVTFDAAQMENERRRLERQLPETRFKRPLAYKVKLG